MKGVFHEILRTESWPERPCGRKHLLQRQKVASVQVFARCRKRVSYKSFPQNCLLQECLQYKSVKQYLALFGRVFSSAVHVRIWVHRLHLVSQAFSQSKRTSHMFECSLSECLKVAMQ